MTNPAHLLLVAHLRRLEREKEFLTEQLLDAHARNATLQRESTARLQKLREVTASRDRWKARAGAFAYRAKLDRMERRRQWDRAETWKCRAKQWAST